MPIRVLIADDHAIIRAALKSLFEDSNIQVVAEAENGLEAVREALRHEVDAVLLDVIMPGGDGLTALSQLKAEKPLLPVIMYSGFENSSFTARAMALGASGYLLKGTARDQLIEAIQKAAASQASV